MDNILFIEAMQQEQYDEISEMLKNIDKDKRLGLFVQRLVDVDETFAKTLEAFIGYELMDRDIRRNGEQH